MARPGGTPLVGKPASISCDRRNCVERTTDVPHFWATHRRLSASRIITALLTHRHPAGLRWSRAVHHRGVHASGNQAFEQFTLAPMHLSSRGSLG